MTTRLLNMAAFGRLLAIAVIVSGVVLSIFDARSLDAYGISHYQLRSFFSESLVYVWYGGTLLALTELATAFGHEDPSGRVDWNFMGLIRALGLIVMLGGLALMVWGARSVPTTFFLHPSNSVLFGSKRAAARGALDYAWRGGLLILVAELANRIGWRGVAEEEPLIEPAPTLTLRSEA